MSVTAELLETVREEARPDTWSAGMGLARAGAVSVQSVGQEEAVLRVRATGRPAPLTTVLYPEDEIWECDCRGRVDPCEHVVAAAIILHHSVTQRAPAQRAPAPRATAQPMPNRPPQASAAQAGPRPGAAPKPERMVYRFKRVDGGLQLERLLVRPDNTARLLAR
ncbi:SWIM zinc finger family protein, partial [Archangium sp.]|uniref:SWIM zinc finger family protein n=1 Tax=Archangium sp. TaxID=1872627 RepID=UPI002ED7F318